MKDNKVHDKRKVRLEELMKKDYIPFMEGRPDRVTIIQNDDIYNLSIALNTTNSVDEFLKAV